MAAFEPMPMSCKTDLNPTGRPTLAQFRRPIERLSSVLCYPAGRPAARSSLFRHRLEGGFDRQFRDCHIDRRAEQRCGAEEGEHTVNRGQPKRCCYNSTLNLLQGMHSNADTDSREFPPPIQQLESPLRSICRSRRAIRWPRHWARLTILEANPAGCRNNRTTLAGGRSSKGCAPRPPDGRPHGSLKAWSSAGPLPGLDKDHAPPAQSRFRAERCPAQAHGMCVPQRGSRTSGAQQGVLLPQRYVQARGQMEQDPPAWLQPPSFH